MFPGIDPQQLEEVQQKIGRFIRATVTTDYKEGTILLRIESMEPNTQKVIPSMVENFSNVLVQQFSMFFGAKTKLIEVNKGLPYSPTPTSQ